jgi:uncharacterized protein YkwD
MRAGHFEQSIRNQSGIRSARCGLAVALALMAAACGSGGSEAPAPAGTDTSRAGAPVNAPATSAGGSPQASAGPAPSPASPAPSPVSPAPPPAPNAFAQDLLARINAIRASAHTCGSTAYPAATPLTWNTRVEDAARTQALYMQGNDVFSHTGANGSSVGDRLSASGYSWNAVGENIAAGYPDAAAVVAGWLGSPGHCANMSNPAYAELGVVMQPGTSANTYSTWWVMVLAHAR